MQLTSITRGLITCLALTITAGATLEFVPLFNGKDLSGWTGEGYIVEDGAIVCTPKGRDLVTEATYSNYVLDFEFKLPPAGNNGLGIHYPGTGNAAYTGMEIQILDDTADKYNDLKPYQFHGSIYTLQPAKKGALKPVGEWNRQIVNIDGERVTVALNGTIILNANLEELEKANPKHTGVKRRSGHIAFLGHGDRVSFRNIRIAEAPARDYSAPAIRGFKPLLTQNSLEGWKHTENPSNWTVHNRIIKHNGKKGPTTHLWTVKSYSDFSLELDWRWAGRGPIMKRPFIQPDGSSLGHQMIEELDSGILLRGAIDSQVNLWNWNCGSGEVWGYRTNKQMAPEIKAALVPKVKADKPVGEWNHMKITMKGEILNVELNGENVIVDARLPGIPESGPIGLQHHGQAIDFANIYIQEY